MDKKLYKDYAKVCEKIKAYEKVKSDLSQCILNDMGDDKTLNLDYGTFSVVEREKYTYSDDCKLMEQSYKETIKKVQEDDIVAGNAKLEIVKNLMFRSKVDDNNK